MRFFYYLCPSGECFLYTFVRSKYPSEHGTMQTHGIGQGFLFCQYSAGQYHQWVISFCGLLRMFKNGWESVRRNIYLVFKWLIINYSRYKRPYFPYCVKSNTGFTGFTGFTGYIFARTKQLKSTTSARETNNLPAGDKNTSRAKGMTRRARYERNKNRI